ncbi:MAG TPA: hypothetical protein VNJ12_06855, partial [Candidatus Dormibacteraeota bacterium]|nr:hypothetical protein [Candidatus Dormibacteraeota bacterium]
YVVFKFVQIPASVQNYSGSDISRAPDVLPEGFFATEFMFLSGATDADILNFIKTQKLLVPPAFSVWASLARHRAHSLAGMTLALAGLFGLAWLFRRGVAGGRSPLR